MHQSILNLKNLTIGYSNGKKKSLVATNLNASMFKGELTCLIGSNGIGKSTLIRTLCGFQNLLEGSITIKDTPIKDLNEKQLSTLISVVLTDRIDVPNATVEEIVGYGRSPYTGIMGRLRNKDLEIIKDSIEKSGIAHKKNSYVNELSDGERQKTFIAKALAQDTPIILLDEPTAFLDLPAKVEVMQLLRDIANKTGKSILMSTHDLNLALQLADNLWLLQANGNLVTGNTEDLLLDNTFQPMFQRNGINFDNKTGLFVVKHKEISNIEIKGEGFHHLLLTRALARKGIKSKSYTNSNNMWIDIDSNLNSYNIFKNKKCIHTETSIGNVIKRVVNL